MQIPSQRWKFCQSCSLVAEVVAQCSREAADGNTLDCFWTLSLNCASSFCLTLLLLEMRSAITGNGISVAHWHVLHTWGLKGRQKKRERKAAAGGGGGRGGVATACTATEPIWRNCIKSCSQWQRFIKHQNTARLQDQDQDRNALHMRSSLHMEPVRTSAKQENEATPKTLFSFVRAFFPLLCFPSRSCFT